MNRNVATIETSVEVHKKNEINCIEGNEFGWD